VSSVTGESAADAVELVPVAVGPVVHDLKHGGGGVSLIPVVLGLLPWVRGGMVSSRGPTSLSA
jgi:hypothetical protein